jgi:hypothetical protein
VSDSKSSPCCWHEDCRVQGADEELLKLGKRLAQAQPELAKMLSWVEELWELYAAEVRRRGTWPEDTAEWTWRDAAAYRATRACIERETEIGAAYVRATDALDACYTQLDPICSAILSFRARTREGRAVKKIARAIQTTIQTGCWRATNT